MEKNIYKFDALANLSAIESIDEDSIDVDSRIINIASAFPEVDCSTPPTSTYFDELTDAVDDSTSVVNKPFSILGRINKYLWFAKRCGTSLSGHIYNGLNQTIYADNSENTTNNANNIKKIHDIGIDMYSATTKFRISNRQVQLVDYNDVAFNTFSSISAFILNSCLSAFEDFNIVSNADNVNYQRKSMHFSVGTAGEDSMFSTSAYIKIDDVLNCQNNKQHDGDGYLYHASASSLPVSHQTIDASDLLLLLNTFIQRLKQYKSINFEIKHRQALKTTKIKVFSQLKSTINAPISNKKIPATQILFNISPYSECTQQLQDKQLIDIETKANKYSLVYQENDNEPYKDEDELPIEVDLRNYKRLSCIKNLNIVYDASSGASSAKSIPLKNDGTNGAFAYEIDVKKNDIFDLKLADVKKLFMLNIGNVISRKNVLKAIDYIFRYWLENMSSINYVITLCHSNCHSNFITMSTGTDFVIYENMGCVSTFDALHYTKCPCGRKISGDPKYIHDLLPTKLVDKENIDIVKAKVNVVITGYTCNLSNSPKSINIEISNSNEERQSITATLYDNWTEHTFATPLPYRQGQTAVQISADPGEPPWFCIVVYVVLYYQTKRTQADNTTVTYIDGRLQTITASDDDISDAKYIITLDYGTSIGADVIDIYKSYGDAITTSTDATPGDINHTKLTRAGYEFKGWYSAATGGTKINLNNYRVTCEAKLFAQWARKYYLAKFYDNDTVNNTLIWQKRLSYGSTFGKLIQLERTVGSDNTQRVFNGWKKFGNPDSGKTILRNTKFLYTTDISCIPIWKDYKILYVIFNAGDGDCSETAREISAGKTYKSVVNKAFPIPTKIGASCTGWYDDPTGENEIRYTDIVPDDTTTDIQLYAHWTDIDYTLTLSAYAGMTRSFTGLHYGSDLPTISNYTNLTTCAGKIFNGYWTKPDGGNQYYNVAAQKIRKVDFVSNLTLYAHWTATQNKVEFYDFYDNTWQLYLTKAYDYGDQLNSLPAAPFQYMHTHYTFDGWFNAPDTTSPENTLRNDTTITVDLSGYAHWSPVNYTLTFDSNTGTGSMESQSITYNTPTQISANAFEKEGYDFAGWSTAADGEVEYADEAEITLTSDMTLYAQWSQQTS